ncbi:hypothetical protein EON65_21965 [archaeon]|nr:MAG: hypothetical protein EON65_21965 [archaeon]
MKSSSNLSSTIITKLRENTTGNEGTHYFDLSNCYIGPAEIADIGTCIKYNGINAEGFAPLISLDLTSNLICGVDQLLRGSVNTEGFSDFCNCLIALNKNSRLRKITFARNYLGASGCSILSNFLINGPSSIIEISCKGCGIDQEGMEKLAEGVKNSKALHILDLRDNELGPESGKYIADMLTNNIKIKQLYLSNCLLGPDGCAAVFHSLGNTSLEVLAINANGCGNSAMDVLASALRVNQRLKTLHIEENGIGMEGIGSLCKGLLKNKVLMHLGLQWNDLDNDCAAKLNEVLVQNNSLKEIHVLGNYIDEQGVKKLVEGSAGIDVDMTFHVRPASRTKKKSLPLEGVAAEGDDVSLRLSAGSHQDDETAREDQMVGGLQQEFSAITNDSFPDVAEES